MENSGRMSDRDTANQQGPCQGLLDSIHQDASTILMIRQALEKKLRQLEVDLNDEDLRQILFALGQTAMNLSRNRDNWEEAHTPELSSLPDGVRLVDLAAHFQETVAFCNQYLDAQEKKLEFVNELNGVQMALADCWLADKILLNLVSNALREADQVFVRLSQQEGGLLLLVEDNGPGFPKEILDHLFEPDVTGYLKGRKNSGIGEGLCLVKRWCDQMNWSVRAENQKQGAQVRVSIPQNGDAAAELRSTADSLSFAQERKWQVEQELFSIMG